MKEIKVTQINVGEHKQVIVHMLATGILALPKDLFRLVGETKRNIVIEEIIPGEDNF